MYRVKVEIRASSIEGKGLFAKEPINKGDIVWLYKSGHDTLMTEKEFKKKTLKEIDRIKRVGYLSPWSGLWIIPPKNDFAEYTNHSKSNNTSVVFDRKISSEPYFIANRDIKKGEEITNNYNEFDLMTRKESPDWV